jgi:hypothetical protein
MPNFLLGVFATLTVLLVASLYLRPDLWERAWYLASEVGVRDA